LCSQHDNLWSTQLLLFGAEVIVGQLFTHFKNVYSKICPDSVPKLLAQSTDSCADEIFTLFS
jgi:hypothetical protein